MPEASKRDIAIFCCVLSAVLLSAGSLMQKASVVDSQGAVNVSWISVLGSIFVVVGVLIGAVACGYLPLTSIAVLNACTVITSHILEILFCGLELDLMIGCSIFCTALGTYVFTC